MPNDCALKKEGDCEGVEGEVDVVYDLGWTWTRVRIWTSRVWNQVMLELKSNAPEQEGDGRVRGGKGRVC